MNASAMTCAILDLIGIASIKLEISQVATDRYLKLSKSFSMIFMTTDKLSIFNNQVVFLGGKVCF